MSLAEFLADRRPGMIFDEAGRASAWSDQEGEWVATHYTVPFSPIPAEYMTRLTRGARRRKRIEARIQAQQNVAMQIETARRCYDLAYRSLMAPPPGETALEAVINALNAYIQELENQ